MKWGVQKYRSLSDAQAFSPPAAQCSQPERVTGTRHCDDVKSSGVKDQKESGSAVSLALSRCWQFDFPSQISCTLYKSEWPTLSPVTDSKEGLRTGRAQVFFLSDAFKAAS